MIAQICPQVRLGNSATPFFVGYNSVLCWMPFCYQFSMPSTTWQYMCLLKVTKFKFVSIGSVSFLLLFIPSLLPRILNTKEVPLQKEVLSQDIHSVVGHNSLGKTLNPLLVLIFYTSNFNMNMQVLIDLLTSSISFSSCTDSVSLEVFDAQYYFHNLHSVASSSV